MPRKGESIFKRKDGRWEGRYIKGRQPNGKAIYGYIYAHNYYDVKRKMRDTIHNLEQAIDVPRSQDGSSPGFRALSMEWLESVRPRIKVSSYHKYRNLLFSYILPVWDQEALSSITTNRIQELCNYLLVEGGKTGSGLSPKTVADTLSVIRSILRYAQSIGIPTVSSGEGIVIRQEIKELCILSHSEQDVLYRYLIRNPTNKNLGLLLCLFSGLRIGEICALTWEDISMTDQIIHVNKTMQRVQAPEASDTRTVIMVTTPKSQCSIRTIPLPPNITEIIGKYYPDASGYVLSGNINHGIEPRTMENHFKQVSRQLNIRPMNFHALRHTFATRCVEVGFDIKSLSEILGHANVAFTMSRYVHPTMQMKKENMQKLSDRFMVR